MDQVFFFIEDIADFSDEIAARASRDEVDASDEGWLDRQILDPLFLLNSRPFDEFWHSINYISSYSMINIVSEFDSDITARWLREWEIPFDYIISQYQYRKKCEVEREEYE